MNIYIKNRQSRIQWIREYRGKYPKKYERVYNYAWKNWEKLCRIAQKPCNYWTNKRFPSIAEQLEDAFNIPNYVSEDITESISILKHL